MIGIRFKIGVRFVLSKQSKPDPDRDFKEVLFLIGVFVERTMGSHQQKH